MSQLVADTRSGGGADLLFGRGGAPLTQFLFQKSFSLGQNRLPPNFNYLVIILELFANVDEIFIPGNSGFTVIYIPVLHTSVLSSQYNVEVYCFVQLLG